MGDVVLPGGLSPVATPLFGTVEVLVELGGGT
jgi:hypothetical protein